MTKSVPFDKGRHSRFLASITTIALSLAGLGLLASVPGMPVAAADSPFTEYPLPSGSLSTSGITVGADGELWFGAGLSSATRTIDRMTTDGVVTAYPVTTFEADPHGFVTGPDGNVWFTEYGISQIGRITPLGQITEYPTISPDSGPLQITVGPDAALWFAESQSDTATEYIGRITTSGQETEYPVPSSSSLAGGIAAGSDGNLWFTEVGKIGKITPSGDVTEYLAPTGRGCCGQITAGPDGNLWFTGQDDNGIGEIGTITTAGDITEYPISAPGATPAHITTGPDGNVWFTDQSGNIGRVDASGSITEYAVPVNPHGGQPNDIVTGPDGALWFTESGSLYIGRVLINSPGPTNLSVTTFTHAPSLSWDALSGAVSYNVYRRVNGGADTLINATTGTTFVDTSAPGDTFDFYYVTAVTGAGESPPSNGVGVIVLPALVPPTFTSASSLSVGMRTPFDFTVTTTGNPMPSLTYAGSLPLGVTFADNGNGTADLAGMPPVGSAGIYSFTIIASNGTSGSPVQQAFSLTVTTATSLPSIDSSYGYTDSYGVPFTFTVNTIGYPPPSLKKTGTLPAGVKFTDNGDGTATLSGTPSGAAAGIYPLIFTAKNSAGTDIQDFTLTITKIPVFNAILTKSLTAVVGTAFSMTVTTSAYDTAQLAESGTLPAGLSFRDNGGGTATISGTPSAGSGGAYPVTEIATNSHGTTSKSFTLSVVEPPTITSGNSATAFTNSPFAFQVMASGYPVPKFTITGTLPAGVKFSSNGTFSGTPKAGSARNYALVITATNTQGTTTQAFELIVL
jgi:streptogramin lyase